MSFQEAVKSGFDHYVNFKGRAARPAYWWWFLFAVIVGIVTSLIDNILGTGSVINSLAALALFLPGLSVLIRRLHDSGKSGWWVLIAFLPLIGLIVLLVFVLTKSDPGSNEYGPDPKGGVSGS